MRGSRGRTSAYRNVPALRNDWVTFVQPPVGFTLTPVLRRKAEAFWETLDLSGAIVLHRLELDTRKIVPDMKCRDVLLGINVHFRQRDGLLLADFPLLEPSFEPQHPWSTDDPRLLAAARALASN